MHMTLRQLDLMDEAVFMVPMSDLAMFMLIDESNGKVCYCTCMIDCPASLPRAFAFGPAGSASHGVVGNA